MHINLYKLCVVSHASPTSNSEGTPLETTDPLLRNRLCSSSPETFHCRSQDPRSGLRASGSVTQSNTMQNSSVCSSAQKRFAWSPPLLSAAQSLPLHQRSQDTTSHQGVHTAQRGLSSCRDPGEDPSATLKRPGCVPETHSPPTSLLRTGPCLSFIYVRVWLWLGSVLAQNSSIRFLHHPFFFPGYKC